MGKLALMAWCRRAGSDSVCVVVVVVGLIRFGQLLYIEMLNTRPQGLVASRDKETLTYIK